MTMLKRLLTVVIAGVMIMCLPAAAVFGFANHTTTELLVLKTVGTAAPYYGVHIFSPLNGPTAGVSAAHPTYNYMIDMYGKLVNKWAQTGGTNGFGNILEPVYAVPDAGGKTAGHMLRTYSGPVITSVDPYGVLFAFGGYIEEKDWFNNPVWSYTAFAIDPWGNPFRQTHDFRRIWNKALNQVTTLFVAGQLLPVAYGQALGANTVSNSHGSWSLNGIYEIDQNGNVIWMWSFKDHTCSTSAVNTAVAPNALQYSFAANGAQHGRLDVNINNKVESGLAVDWVHINSMDYDDATGLIVMNSRNLNEFYVIDHDGTFATMTVNGNVVADPNTSVANCASSMGDFKYRFGAAMNYLDPTGSQNSGPSAGFYDRPSWGANGTVQIWGAHQVQWIHPYAYGYAPAPGVTPGPALPQNYQSPLGYNNVLIWDNHENNSNPLGGVSEIKEICPYVTKKISATSFSYSSSSVFPDQAKYSSTVADPSEGSSYPAPLASDQITWLYTPSWCTESSGHISGAQRLPNGNSIGNSGETGSFYEVSNSGTLVWEYVNPVQNGVAIPWMENATSSSPNQVFRSYRYDIGHPGIAPMVTQVAVGQYLPKTPVPGMGQGVTLTGRAPCTNQPCMSGTSVGGF